MDKIKNIIIGVLAVALIGVGYKAFNYRSNLLEKKKVIAVQEEKIKEEEAKLLKSVMLGYEALMRAKYIDTYRTYGLRNPHEWNTPDFNIILNKSSEITGNYVSFLNELGYAKEILVNTISGEKKDFSDVIDKYDTLRDLMIKEDEAKKK